MKIITGATIASTAIVAIPAAQVLSIDHAFEDGTVKTRVFVNSEFAKANDLPEVVLSPESYSRVMLKLLTDEAGTVSKEGYQRGSGFVSAVKADWNSTKELFRHVFSK
jgi:hypothetical protein